VVSFDKRKAIQKAMTLVQQGQLEQAIAEYRLILDVDPSDTSLCNTLGDLYLQVGATSEATACYLKLVDVLKAEGLIFRAIAVYKKILKLNPDNLSAVRACADLYATEGLRAEAKHMYLMEAERSLKSGLDKQALEAYERLVGVDPGDTAGAAKLASLLAREGRRSEAADLLGRLAQECRAQRRLENARTLYRQMVEIAPGAFTGWYCLGRVEFETGQFQDAEEHLRRAAEIDASSPLPHLLLGHVYEQQKQIDRAKAAWRTVLEFDPTHQEVHHRLGLLCLNEGDTEAAVKEFDAAAHSLEESGELERAIVLLGDLGPAADHPLIQERLGELLERSGRPGEAKAAYRRSAELYLATGRVGERKRMLGRILSLDPNDSEAIEGVRTAGARGSSPALVLESETDASRALWPRVDEAERAEEMRVVLEDTEQENLLILRAGEESVGGVPAALAIVDFYLKQGMEAEARALLRRLVAADPGNSETSRQLESLESKALTEGAPVAPEIEVIQLDLLEGMESSAPFWVSSIGPEDAGESGEECAGVSQARETDEKEYVNLMAKLEQGLLVGSDPWVFQSTSDQDVPHPDADHPIDRSPETCEAHYQLGMAYRELGLVDEAIEEFRRSAADERLTLLACDMVGLCLLAKGDAEAAIHELNKGLWLSGRPVEEYRGIKYSLATAHQSIGDLEMAASILRDLEVESPSFRDVKDRLRKLRENLGLGGSLSTLPEGSLDATRQTRSG
jgi:tetratricopeptide (TPR) repeat protein